MFKKIAIIIITTLTLTFNVNAGTDGDLLLSKNDPAKVEELLSIFDERKKEPIDYRRGGVITLFVGIGISLLGFVTMGNFFQAVGYLVATIGVGILIAGYLYPNTGKELTDAVEEYEKK